MTTYEKYEAWLANPYFDESIKDELRGIAGQEREIEERFYQDLKFGTAGLRGIMGAGTNRMNVYTVRKATQGLANYILKNNGQERGVAIACDSRHMSREFCEEAALCLAANGIKAYVFDSLRPTPELSYAVRKLGCISGINVTASHNPPEYNGYKVYWNDGAQIVPPNDDAIIKEVYATKFEDIKFNGNDDLIEWIGEEQDDVYIDRCIAESLYQKDKIGYENLNIVFTSIHGTTYTTIPKALEKAGFKKIDLVTEQMIPSGNFPTVESPNPEEPKALQMAVDLANITNGDIVIGCDPDGDRLGIAVRNLDGEIQLLNGNQTNMILTDYILNQWKNAGRITGKEFIGSTIVTSDVFFDLAEQYGVDCKAGLTGFKWIGKMIRDAEGVEKFICGGEESFGFMTGDFVRDKDSCGSILVACEIAAWCKANGRTMYQYMIDIYKKVGVYQEALVNVVRKGRTGAEEISQMMIDFRNNPPKSLAGSLVKEVKDFQEQTCLDAISGEKKVMNDIPKSNVLIYYTEDGTKICIRPSGTEPKIKFYFSVKGSISSEADYKTEVARLEKKIDIVKKDLKL